jgi:hypothetical protein
MLTEKTERKYPRALEEVWEWRRKVEKNYEAIAHLPPEEHAAIINERGEEIMRRLGLNLPRYRGPGRKAD